VNAERWKRLKEQFDAVVGRGVEECAQAVERLRSVDPAAAEELSRLLASDAQYAADEGGGAEAEERDEPRGAAATNSTPPPDPQAGASVGERVGGYELVEFLSAGGTSEVYRAQPTDGAGPAVAIKALHRGLASREVRRRFALERRTLAALDHPGIVALSGADSMADGRPCLVMEYVEGTPIDVHCREAELDTRERLELFVRVCAAVRHAHRNLVVHRDLKPANVLVTQSGLPKVLDFGVVKLLAPEDGDEATHPGWIAPLTPRYASPEQWSGGPITTATDVFSLGVILGELLAPCAPRAGGDLDLVVSTATQPDPELRYPSVESLSADVERFLSGLPIRARKPSLVYQASRFVRRNRASVAVSGVLLAALITALFFLHTQWRRAQRAELRGWQAHGEALQVSTFFQRLVDASNPADLIASEGFVEALDAAASRVGEDLADRPEAEGRVRYSIARVYAHLGRYDEARAHAEIALERAANHPGFDNNDRAAIRRVIEEVGR